MQTTSKKYQLFGPWKQVAQEPEFLATCLDSQDTHKEICAKRLFWYYIKCYVCEGNKVAPVLTGSILSSGSYSRILRGWRLPLGVSGECLLEEGSFKPLRPLLPSTQNFLTRPSWLHFQHFLLAKETTRTEEKRVDFNFWKVRKENKFLKETIEERTASLPLNLCFSWGATANESILLYNTSL